MSGPAKRPSPTIQRVLAGVLVLLGAGSAYWAFQPEGPESFGRFEVFGELLMGWKVGPVSPLMLLLGVFLIAEAAKMWRKTAR